MRDAKAPALQITANDPPAAWAASQTGPREQNEDDYGRADQDTRDYPWKFRGCLYVLADGMGGLDAGKQASATAVREVIQRYKSVGQPVDVADNLVKALEHANKALYDSGARNGKRMGSTLVACVLQNGTARIAHVGDSRAYHLANGELHRCTQDHLYATEVLGIKDDDQAKHSPEGHKITRALGKDPDLRVDLNEVGYGPGDRFLLCSDGISEVLDPAEIRECMMGPTPQSAVRKLSELATSRLRDNATAVVVFASGKKIRNKKLRKQIAMYAAAAVVVAGLSFAGYKGWGSWSGYKAKQEAANKPRPKQSGPATQTAVTDNTQTTSDGPNTAGPNTHAGPQPPDDLHSQQAPPKKPEGKLSPKTTNPIEPVNSHQTKQAVESHDGSPRLTPTNNGQEKQRVTAPTNPAAAIAGVDSPQNSGLVDNKQHATGVVPAAPAPSSLSSNANVAAVQPASPAESHELSSSASSTPSATVPAGTIKKTASTPTATHKADKENAQGQSESRTLKIRNATGKSVEFWWDVQRTQKVTIGPGDTNSHTYSKIADIPPLIYWKYARGGPINLVGHKRNVKIEARQDEIVITDNKNPGKSR